MGKPAARQGDLTSHGGTISMGCPTVLIGGMPAARVGDMHTCPMVNPGTPPPPHVGGPVMPPGSPTVLIGGMPAARVGDMCTCAGPPDTIAMGCFTVLIGESGAGGGGGGSGGGGAGAPTSEGAGAAGSGATGSASLQAGQGPGACIPQMGPMRVSQAQAAEEETEEVEQKGAQITNAQWERAEVKCGDPLDMLASTVNISPGTNATFAVKRTTDQATVGTERANTSGNSVRTTWISKKSGPQWTGRPELMFQVSARGAQADSANQLSFHAYPDRSREEITLTRIGTNAAGWSERLRDGRFQTEFRERVLHITIRIKLLNRLQVRPSHRQDDEAVPIGSPLPDSEKQEMASDIESYLSERLRLHRELCKRGARCDCRNQCCKFDVQIHVQFVESGEHHVVNLWPGRDGADSVNWYRVKYRPNSRAHETGHLLGWFDEYASATYHGPQPRWRTDRPGAIMQTGAQVVEEYYYDYRDWHARKTGENWQLVGN